MKLQESGHVKHITARNINTAVCTPEPPVLDIVFKNTAKTIQDMLISANHTAARSQTFPWQQLNLGFYASLDILDI